MQLKKYWPWCLFLVLALLIYTRERNQLVETESVSPQKKAEEVDSQKQGVVREKMSKKVLPKLHGRILVGREAERFEHSKAKLPLVNSPHSFWKRLAKKNLLRHRSEDAKIDIQVLGSYIKIKNGKGRFVEKILVTQTKKGKPGPSFNAIVDSQSGRILSTYNRTINEYFVSPPKFKWSVRPLLQH